MNGVVVGILAALLGGVIAVGAALGLVANQSAPPPPVNKPFIVYGSN